MSIRLNNIAVLIDADNASAHNIGYILQKIATLGRITCKKIYGDWGNMHIQSWQEALLKYAIEPMQHFAYVKGKNATDIGMVIEAMDLLYSGAYDGFCLISSDSDFTSLALRIRKNNVQVFGFGKRNTVSAFSQACDQFFYVEDLLPLTPQKLKPSTQNTSTKNVANDEKTAQNAITTSKAVDSLKVTTFSANNISAQASTKQTRSATTPINNKHALIEAWDGSRLKCDTKLLKSLRASIVNHPKAKPERWLNFGLLSHGMKEHYSDFNPQDYGYAKLADIVRNIDIFEMKTVSYTLYVRDKTNKQTSSATTPSVNTTNMPKRWTTKKLQTQTHLIGALNKLITENPNSNKGWTNISYLASQIRQNHINIKWDKYGYPKFSDLIKSLSLYDIRIENNAVLVKLKTESTILDVANKSATAKINPQPNQTTPASSIKLADNGPSKLLPKAHTSVIIYSSSQTDIKLFCMNTKQKSDAAKDIIHVGQRYSKDSSILLTRKEANGIAKSNFICSLEKQEKDINQLIFVVVSKSNNTFSKDCPIIEVTINQRHKGILLSKEFNVQHKTGKNLLLFTLNRVNNEWQFLPQNTIISGDLRDLCNIPDTLKS